MDTIKGIIVLIGFTLVAIPAAAQYATPTRVRSIFVFGDSLSDTGLPYGAYAYSNKTAPPASPHKYWRGRWSNGPIWADYLSQWLKVPLTSFAVAGATALNISNLQAWFAYGHSVPVQNLRREIGIFAQHLASKPNVSMAGSVCIVAAGTNDLGWLTENISIVFNETALKEFVSNLVGTILGSASVLANEFKCSGIIVSNLAAIQLTPVFTITPGSELFRPVVVQIVSSVNSALAAGVKDLRMQLRNTTAVASFDMYSLMTRIVSNCSNFRLSNCTDRCLNTSPYNMDNGPSSTYNVTSICPRPNEFLFWDGLHPTSFVHEIFGLRMLNVICQRLGMC
jgi:phospholipase/lecithinase/hemolysin